MILIDGDASPTKNIILEIASLYSQKVLLFIDDSHVLNNNNFDTIIVSKGFDSVDMAILKHLQKDDLVITDDYGLASLALIKTKYVLTNKGIILTNENINYYLTTRYEAKKARDMKIRLKNIPKRSLSDDDNFKKSLTKILKEKLETNLNKID